MDSNILTIASMCPGCNSIASQDILCNECETYFCSDCCKDMHNPSICGTMTSISDEDASFIMTNIKNEITSNDDIKDLSMTLSDGKLLSLEARISYPSMQLDSISYGDLQCLTPTQMALKYSTSPDTYIVYQTSCREIVKGIWVTLRKNNNAILLQGFIELILYPEQKDVKWNEPSLDSHT